MNDELHKIAKDMVDEAEKNNAIIAIGNLNGVRNNNKYIRYKAMERGIAVIEVPVFRWGRRSLLDSGNYTSPFCQLSCRSLS